MGIDERPRRYLQPRFGITIMASATRRITPIGQKRLNVVDILALYDLGENSDSRTKDWKTPPAPKPTRLRVIRNQA